VKKAKLNQNLSREKDNVRDLEPEDSNYSLQPKQKSTINSYPKSLGNPDYLFFDSLKKILEENSFKNLIKLLHLYVEVIIKFMYYFFLYFCLSYCLYDTFVYNFLII